MTRNEAARAAAKADPEGVAVAAAASEELAETLAAWTRPYFATLGFDHEDEHPAPMAAGDVERDEAAWQRERDGKTPVWRAILVFDLRMQRRAGPGELAVMAQYGFRYDSRVNAEAICEHLAELAAADATDGTSLLALVVEAMPRSLTERHIVSPAVMPARGRLPERVLVRSPAVLSLATLPPVEAVEVDGEPLVTRTPEKGLPMKRYRPRPAPAQGDLWPAPRTLGGNPTGDLVLDTLATYPLSGDERATLRGDVLRMGQFVYAVTAPVRLTEADGAFLLTGSRELTEATKRRLLAATETMRFATMYRADGWPMPLAVVDYGGDTINLNAPLWWREERERLEGSRLWRLSGGLFRPVRLGDTEGRGHYPGQWGTLARTVSGIEAALGYGPTAGRGRSGRIPDAFRPASGKAGPGPAVFVTWRAVLRLAGEHLPDDADPRESYGRRYRRRVQAFEDAGFMANGNRAAKAGDTIEVVSAQTGTRTREPGIWVRATARFVEAYKRGQKRSDWERYPAARVFRNEGE